ncbi:MAG TPA: methyltransferase domain-containing protein, partial [Isosphaeraceae bacterium]|nr:methyltransferase domain-containing protein [Isosphaeraceae bacterium]
MSAMIARLRASRLWKVWQARGAAGRGGLDPAARRVLAGFRPSLIENRAQYLNHQLASADLDRLRQESFRASVGTVSLIETDGFCFPCRTWRSFATPGGASGPDGAVAPNWREGLICPVCGLNSRMRASVHLLKECLKPTRGSRLYVTEQVTPLYRWVKARYRRAVGSEFVRDGTRRGHTNAGGIRHEDMTALSFADGSLDHIVSLEVLEHVPDFRQALRECA